MGFGKKQRAGEEGSVNMTPMIDIVFQLIIFFVCTVQLEKDTINETIRLAMAPDAKAVEKRDPLTVTIDVDKDGNIEISRRRLTPPGLYSVMKASVNNFGQMIPVVIRADSQTPHAAVKKVMDEVTRAGIWKIKFAAIKDKA